MSLSWIGIQSGVPWRWLTTATSASMRSRYSAYSGHVGTRRHELRDEGDALAELRVLLEEEVEGGEAAQDVLGQVRAVDAQDQVVAPAAQELLLLLRDAVGRGDAEQSPWRRSAAGSCAPTPRGPRSARPRRRSRRRAPAGRGSTAGSCAGRSEVWKPMMSLDEQPAVELLADLRRAARARRRAASTGCGRSGAGRRPGARGARAPAACRGGSRGPSRPARRCPRSPRGRRVARSSLTTL